VKNQPWEMHYANDKSVLAYPDENLVRMVKKNLPEMDDPSRLLAVDCGCGSGRHLKFLSDIGIAHAIGIDASYNALVISRSQCPGAMLQGTNKYLPLKNETADIVIAWGSLHYNNKYDCIAMLEEIQRIIKIGGCLFATLRSSRDTYLKKGRHLGNDIWITDLQDLDGSIASFYNESELKTAFSIFSDFSYGLIERTVIGDLSSLISHWVIQARK
jgi:ubiquinone/menaquinone biosynthesis C-methylase UbiE